MNIYIKTALLILLGVSFAGLLWTLTAQTNMPLLQPKGLLAQQEMALVFTATLLMLAVVVPVFLLTALIAWRYRASNTSARYLPNWEHNIFEELVWWGVPCIIIFIIAHIAIKSSYELDPFVPLGEDHIQVQVVALNWKWLFIYPKEGIATINTLTLPAKQPVEFSITSDAPMNSFWIPQLSGQIYAMTGMVTKLHIIADTPGTYTGFSANLSGKGFSGMTFETHIVPEQEFDAWVATNANEPDTLDDHAYQSLSEPSVHDPVRYYGRVSPGLFDSIVKKYMPTLDSMSH
jgi:cytochrome o ubiquinol oxidase subunit 2